MLVETTAQLDPNWFYSSIAQCAAAVVGLLGAVLSGRLQEQRARVRESHEEVSVAIRNLRAAVRSTIDRLEAHIAWTESLGKPEGPLVLKQKLTALWSGAEIGSHVDISIAEIETAHVRSAAARILITALEHPRAPSNILDLGLLAAAYAHASAVLQTDEDRRPIETWQLQIEGIQGAHRHHRAVASVSGAIVFTSILGWIIAFGVVVPLEYLSSFDVNSKQSLITLFGVGLAAIPIFLANEIRRIRSLRIVNCDARL